ncbi:MAG: universal stress protein [Desulfohalobiaceae bacterium]|nr:universal stress protein [Desulfohalobiaceae bacterium]
MLPKIRHLLVCTDFSRPSWQALTYGASLAQYAKARMTLLHVLPTLPKEFTYSGVSNLFDWGPGMAGVPLLFPDSEQKGRKSQEKHPGEFVEKAERTTKEQLKSHLMQLKTQESGFNWQAIDLQVQIGEPVRGILQELESEKYDIVVLGRHGHGKTRGGRCGGVAREVLNNSSVPVFMVDSQEEG